MNLIKTSTAITTLAVALALASPSLAVVDVDASNSTTGSESNNQVNTTVESTTKVDNQNSANITNTINIKADTGNNSASNNTGDASIDTGKITGSVQVTNEGNINNIGDPTAGNSVSTINNINANGDVTVHVANANTGSNSSNEVNFEIKNAKEINNSNSANVSNFLNVDLNTGGNKADDNTGNAQIKTGSIVFNLGIVNCLNFNNVNSKNSIECPTEKNVPTKNFPALVPFIGLPEPAPLVPNVLATTIPVPIVPVSQDQILEASILPITGSEINFRWLLLTALTLTLGGLMIRQRANNNLALVYALPQRRIRTRNSI